MAEVMLSPVGSRMAAGEHGSSRLKRQWCPREVVVSWAVGLQRSPWRQSRVVTGAPEFLARWGVKSGITERPTQLG